MIKTGFITPLRVEAVSARNWCLLEDFVFVGSKKHDTFICKKGMLTDFASVPWWTQAILPRTGTWTQAATLHDMMCEELNAVYAHNKSPRSTVFATTPFSSVDADAIFRKNAREGGTGVIRSELLWLGVRLGALANPARRKGWRSTSLRVGADIFAVVAFLYLVVFLILWIAHGFPAVF